jgi:hypothetical protein
MLQQFRSGWAAWIVKAHAPTLTACLLRLVRRRNGNHRNSLAGWSPHLTHQRREWCCRDTLIGAELGAPLGVVDVDGNVANSQHYIMGGSPKLHASLRS